MPIGLLFEKDEMYDDIASIFTVINIVKVGENASLQLHIFGVEVEGGSAITVVTSIGMSYDEAGALVSLMYGDFRMPTLLKEVDTHSLHKA